MLVGREQELRVLNDSFRKMQEGKGSVLFITGEAGLGKTTLIHEWWARLSPSALYAEAACSIPIGNTNVGKIEALQPWADVIAQLQSYDHETKKGLDIKRLLHDAAPSWAWAIPIVGDLAHAAVETTRLIHEQRSGMNANANSQQQVFQQYVNFITKVSEKTPLVFLLDDMHWADASSTNLLFYLSRQIVSMNVLVIATYRPDDAIAGEHPVITIKNEILRYDAGKELALGYLGGDEIRELLTATFPEYHVNDAFEQWLQKISDGNVLFATQFIKTLHEDGHLNEQGTFVGEYENITIPDSALAVVMERTRRLSDETRELLSYATAEGEEFTSYVLGQLTSKKPLELLRELRKAESAGFVQSKKGMRQFANQTTSVFGFSHALFHKALYDSLLSEERVILHRQCYEILKTEWDRLSATQERTMPLASKLLTHAEKCGEIEIAAEIALETAKAAWIGFSKDETLTMLDATQRLLDSSDAGLPPASRTSMMGDIFLLRSKIMSISGRLPDALNMVSEAMKIFERTPNDKRYMETVVEMSRTLSKLGRIPEAEEFARKALATAETAGDDEGIAQGYSEIANVLNLLSRYDEALEYNERALDLLKRTNNQYRIAATLNNIGLGYSALGDAEKAMHYYKESLKISEPLGNRYLIGWSLGRIGREYHNIDENDKALEYIERGIKLQESIGNVSDVSYLLNTLGGVYESRGDLVKALECYKRHHDVGEYTGNPQHQAEGLNNMSQIYRAMNDLAHARECAAQAREIAKNVDSVYLEGYAIAQLGLIDEAEAELATGEERAAKLRGALAYMQEAADIYHKIKHHQAKFFDEELLRIRGKIGT